MDNAAYLKSINEQEAMAMVALEAATKIIDTCRKAREKITAGVSTPASSKNALTPAEKARIIARRNKTILKNQLRAS